MSADETLSSKTIDTIRTLAIDAVEKANSGHPGAPMALAPAAYTLWSRFLRYDPDRPDWPNRDRFVLSNGHASMLLYALLHLSGVKEIGKDGRPTGKPAVSLDDIKNFRQLDSKTPGHPEYRHTTGVETTTGPLGQGCGNSVGMAIAAKWKAARFNRGSDTLFDSDVYVFCSDGDMMEGVASEAASLAGHLKLSNLCWIYDNNSVTIEGHTPLAFSEDVAERFRGYGWNTLHVADAEDCEAIAHAIETFQTSDDAPTLILLDSVIGFGAPDAGTSKLHSDAMGEEAVRATKRAYGWPEDAQFLVPDGVADHFHRTMAERVKPLTERWDSMLADWRTANPDLASAYDAMESGALPDGWESDLPSFTDSDDPVATRNAGGEVLVALAQKIPTLVGGAADLAPSTKTKLDFPGAGALEADSPGGRTMHFGIREHAMGAIANGMAVSGLRPFTATFLVFSDYMRPPMRLAALMEVPTLFIFTHDSIGVGEDGPTHQPVEQIAGLRAIPNMHVFRPADAHESREAWKVAVQQSRTPSTLIFSRQKLPILDEARDHAGEGVAKGAYILADAEGGDPDLILMATGSEVSLCLDARVELAKRGVKTRVVSMPCWSLFEQQDAAYREKVLPRTVTTRLAVEAASPLGWDRYTGPDGDILAMHGFGASGPAPDVQEKFGFTVDHVCKLASALVRQAEPA
ncbi:transketolase [Stakelama sediminis]|uniref:Transketolase n=1 Tax=Stakelama sediminis TaxID=463200 RepID=A0A840YW47_9SPHN|nr:transketolase [Stakelama sediminis]MBB5717941.1 transketolase [Stakelama sediminis]